jgi:hypothetical protein
MSQNNQGGEDFVGGADYRNAISGNNNPNTNSQQQQGEDEIVGGANYRQMLIKAHENSNGTANSDNNGNNSGSQGQN